MEASRELDRFASENMAEVDTTRTVEMRRQAGEGPWRPASEAVLGGSRPTLRAASRLVVLGWAVGLLFPSPAAAAGPGRQQSPAPIERRPPEVRSQNNGFPVVQAGPAGQASSRQALAGQAPAGQQRGFRGPHGEHLAGWLNQHSHLNLQQQEQALDQEPGFHDLPPETQQRYRNRLAQLDAMNPQRRQNMLARNEALERLSPEQRAQVRGALGQLGSMPPDQRHAVAQTFRALRDLPADQRYAALNSGRFGGQLNGVQRNVLSNLLSVEPMLPPPNRAAQPAYPQGAQPMQPGYQR